MSFWRSFLQALPNSYVWGAALFAALGSVLTGYCDGSMNGILEMKGFHEAFHQLYYSSDEEDSVHQYLSNDTVATGTLNNTHVLDNSTQCSSGNGAGSDILIGLMVSISNLGSAGGSLMAGWLADQFGRKYGLLISGLVIVVGSATQSASLQVWTFVVGRLITGIGIGLIYMVMPIYISEVSPSQSRGMLGTLIGPGYAGGILIALCANIWFSEFTIGWRVATSIQAASGLLFAVGAWWVPRTPRWLVLKHREKEARCVLAKLNRDSKKGGLDIDTSIELEELCGSIQGHPQQSKCGMVIREMFRYKYLSRLLLVVLLFFLVAMIGNFLLFYSSTLFCKVGMPPFLTALAVGLILLLGSIILLFFIDKAGRKATLLVGSLAHLILAVFVASLLLVYRDSSHVVTVIVVVLICVYALSLSLTWLTIPWLISSEVFPVHIRGVMVAVATSSYWIFTLIINQLIPLLFGSALQVHGFFYIVAGVNLLSIFLVVFALPETMGVSLEQMDELFARGFLPSLRDYFCPRRSKEEKKLPQLKYLEGTKSEEVNDHVAK